jgi:hypothetical protein
MAKITLDELITWAHETQTRISVLDPHGQKSYEALEQVADLAEMVKRLEERLTEDSELGLGYALQSYIDGQLHFLKTGEEW